MSDPKYPPSGTYLEYDPGSRTMTLDVVGDDGTQARLTMTSQSFLLMVKAGLQMMEIKSELVEIDLSKQH